MIFIRLRHLAVILLVLLFVVSAMGGDNELSRYIVTSESSVCLSFRYKNLTDCCSDKDHMQKIYVTKVMARKGIYHTKNLKRILCYDDMRGKFKLMKRSTFKKLDKCQRKRHRRQSRRASAICPFTKRDKELLHNPMGSVRCVLHETMGNYFYLSVEENDKFLAIRNGRVQKHKNKRGELKPKPREVYTRFLIMNKNDIRNIKGHKGCVR